MRSLHQSFVRSRYWNVLVAISIALGLAFPTGSAAQVMPEEYDVMSAVLDHFEAGLNVDSVAVRDTTVGRFVVGGRDLFERVIREMPTVSDSLANAYGEVNATSSPLAEDGFSAAKPVTFDKTAPATFWILSRVGFNSGETEALVHVVEHCGPRCISGRVVRLDKVSGAWVIKEAERTLGPG